MKLITKLFVCLLLVVPVLKTIAQSEKVLMEEHFNENANGWNLGDDKDVVRKIEDGKMIMECKKYLTNGGGYWIKAPDVTLPATNFSVAVTTHWIKNMKTDDSYSPYGIIISDYYFLIYGDGNRRMLKYNSLEKKYETIVDWGESSVIHKRADGDNKLEVKYQNGKAAFYVNGQMMYKKDAEIDEGSSVKLYIENSEMVAFDDLIVKKLASAATTTTMQEPDNSAAALEFNNMLMDIIDSLYYRGKQWGEELNTAMDNDNYSKLPSMRKETQRFIDRKISYVTGLKDVGGSQEFQRSMISLLNYEKELLTKSFLPFEKLNASSSQEAKDSLLANLTEQSKQEDAFLKTMKTAQHAYANKNGFTIEDEESEEEGE